jgi:hypothetical protein
MVGFKLVVSDWCRIENHGLVLDFYVQQCFFFFGFIRPLYNKNNDRHASSL